MQRRPLVYGNSNSSGAAGLDVFEVIASPVRRALLVALAGGPLAVRDLATRFSISRSAISQHLRVLKDAGLVSQESVGKEHWYQVQSGPLEDIEEWVSGLTKRRRRAGAARRPDGPRGKARRGAASPPTPSPVRPAPWPGDAH
jgi:DNA-binding transcriptional ArsR family regulator